MSMKVLIVEKEKTIQQSLYIFMEVFYSCEVLLAHSRKEAIFLFESIPFDIVLCGDRLPDGNGLEMLKRFMEQKPNLNSILMTVQGEELLKHEAMQAGIRVYLEKPFDLKQLEKTIGISPVR
jgi:two-component system response regulator AtoC